MTRRRNVLWQCADQRDPVYALEAKLRRVCDPEAVDAEAKASQRAWTERWGGRAAVEAEGFLVFTPPPGHDAEIER